MAWLNRPDLAAERAQVLRLAASGRQAVLVQAVLRLAGRGLPPPPAGWEEQARCTLAAAASDAAALRHFRRACFAEAAQLLGRRRRRHEHVPTSGAPGRPGICRYGPPPRLQGCRGKTIYLPAPPAALRAALTHRWRPAPAK